MTLARLFLLQSALFLIYAIRSENMTGKVYFAIVSQHNQTYGRAFNKTLANVTQDFLLKHQWNITLDTLVIDLPENGSFSSQFLETLCDRFEGKHVVAVFVIGDSPAAFTVNLAATHIGIPVLWARGHSGYLPAFRSLGSNPLEVQLAPTGREMVTALRELLLQAHWHTFTLLADPTSAAALRRPDLWGALNSQPLHPTLIALPSPLRAQALFRKLADISRSTRGVVVLLSDKSSAVRILDDATRLNMMDGHFVWLWIDTSANISIRNTTDEEKERDKEKKDVLEDRDRFKREVLKSDLSDLHINYLLKNDEYLLFNRNSGFDSSKYRVRANIGPTSSRKHQKGAQSDGRAELPAGLLYIRPLPVKVDRHLVKGAVRLLATTLKAVMERSPEWVLQSVARQHLSTSCWKPLGNIEFNISSQFARELRSACTDALGGKRTIQDIGVDKVDKSLVANFEILNLVPERSIKESDQFSTNRSETGDILQHGLKWKRVGMVSGRSVRLDTIVWPGGDLSVAAVSTRARTAFRVVTALAPPFVMESELDEDGQCLRGLPCHRVLTSDKDNLTLVFNEMRRLEDEEEDEKEADSESTNHAKVDYEDEDDDKFFPFQKFKYRTNCCYGLSMDLLENIAQELEFDFRLYIVADGLFGSKTYVRKKDRKKRDVGKKFLSSQFKGGYGKSPGVINEYDSDEYDVKWNGVVGDIVSGAAHMSFAALSVSSARSEVMDFSVPYFFSGVSFLAAPQQKSEIPLLAFLLPFSPELWIAIFTSLNITAIAVAIYEWLSPFGLNPWGRQRSKNFSMSSALWVMWGLLCGHLVAFKAPKSWPNKFLINVWGGFSVIFVASYTANIAALIAGLFFHNTVNNYHDRSLLSQKVGAPKSSAAEYYVQRANQQLWQHMHRYALENVEDGITRLRNGSLDILIADTPILDYYRATDHGCKLQKIGDTINEDTYAIGMTKGFPLKDSISAVIAKYSSNGYMDILQEKWYGGLPCFKLATDIVQPRPLGVAAVTGVFILLGVGIALGLLILLLEHLFFRYTLPRLRDKPKGSVWRSRNIMFFSQKLYRFINCVELVSPHHAARELVHTIRQGQITSLFQKSIKRKEHEQRRRRKSKAQFFEMIQEIRSTIRRQQQEERQISLQSVEEVDAEDQLSPEAKKSKLSPSIIKRTFMRTSPKSETAGKIRSPNSYLNRSLFSPRSKAKTKSSGNLNVRRFSTDSVFNSSNVKLDRSAIVGRRLSKDASSFLTSSPPDINSRRSSYLDIITSGNKLSGKSPVLSIENVSDSSSKSMEPIRKLSDSECIGRKLATLPKMGDSIDRNRLQPQYSLTMGKSDETLTTSDRPKFITAASFSSITEGEKSRLSDDDHARKSREAFKQMHKEMKGKKLKKKGSQENNTSKSANPQITIQIEDTSRDREDKDKEKAPASSKRNKTRHQSLGDAIQAPDLNKRKKLPEQSKSLDSNPPKARTRRRDDPLPPLPPAPPPPNCSPRNSDGRSPLERLSKDELVHLWRSSESELRSHLLKAIREKGDQVEPP